ncbi:MAG: hypothetical protein GXN96_06865 [Aquificae bacterium]|nr:hypothetical protein [Aquificota bacterium]
MGKQFTRAEREILEGGLRKVDEVIKDAQELIKFGERDLNILRERKETLISWAEEILGYFFDQLLSYDKTRRIVESSGVEKGAIKEAFLNWYRALVSGSLDMEIFKNQFFVGLIHVYRGVDNNLMMFMANVLERKFLEKCFQNFSPEEALVVYQAFKNVVDTLIAITVEGYVYMLKESLVEVAGFKPALVERMMMIEIERLYNYFNENIRS